MEIENSENQNFCKKNIQKGLSSGTKCLMLTNDRLNAEQAVKEGLNAVSVRKFTEEVFPDLLDKVAGSNEEAVEVDRNIDYPA